MGKGDIPISEKHGVNPSVMLCFFCQQPSGVALLGKLPNDAQAPREAIFDQEPCDECKKLMAVGVVLISCKDNDQEYRTGGWCVVKDEAVRRMYTGDIVERVLETRVAFVSDSAWDAMGLPRK